MLRASILVLGLSFVCGCGSDDGSKAGASPGGTGGSTTGGSTGIGGGTGGGTGGSATGGTGTGGTGTGGSATGGTSSGGTSSGGSGGTFVVSDCGAGALKDLAATITPGTFVELAGTGYDDSLLDAGQGHQILQYSGKGVWDPNTCQALFLGGGHLSLEKFIAYSASAEQWFQAPNPPWWCDPQSVSNPYQCASHAYHHDALDPATGTFYWRSFNSEVVHRHQVDATIDADWDTIPNLPSEAAGCIATALEYFPERNELVYVDCTNQSLRIYKPGASSWTQVPGPFAMGSYHNYGVYNPVHQVLLFGAGNGSKNLWAYDKNGTVKAVANPPREFHPAPADDSILRVLIADPATGKFLTTATNGDMFEYDYVANAWNQLSQKAPTQLEAAIPVSSYGVVLFLSAKPAKVYAYKH
jgi:hypothetical protein